MDILDKILYNEVFVLIFFSVCGVLLLYALLQFILRGLKKVTWIHKKEVGNLTNKELIKIKKEIYFTYFLFSVFLIFELIRKIYYNILDVYFIIFFILLFIIIGYRYWIIKNEMIQ